jgi:hypothetical protein
VRNYEEAEMAAGAVPAEEPSSKADGVTIEAQFKVGEYDIVVLSAKDSTGLDRWLRTSRAARSSSWPRWMSRRCRR